MAEASWDGTDRTQRLPEKRKLTKLQNDIYELLQKDKPQKALAVAKAVGKNCAKDVNPDLYKMQGWNLLDCNEDKLWRIKAESRASENKAKMEKPIRTGSKTTDPLTEQQREIYTLLEKSRPMRAKDIAKKMEKTRKDVNSDLYTLNKMDLLTYNEEKLWALKSQNDTKCKEKDKECEESGRSPIPSDNNHTDDTTSPNRTETENPKNQLCNNDTAPIGVSSSDHNTVQYFTQDPNGCTTVQSYTQIHPPVTKYYTIYIQNSQNFTVGDNLVTGGDSQDPGYTTGDLAALTDNSGEQYAVQGAEQPSALEWTNSSQSEDGSMNASDLSLAEDIQERPPHTSSPADPNPSRQCINLSAICDGIDQLDLEQQDNHLS